MYFNFTDRKDFPELLYQIPFNELIIQDIYSVNGIQYDGEGKISKTDNIKFELSNSETTDFSPALNFYRLLLNKPNKKYTKIQNIKIKFAIIISKKMFKIY